MTPKESTDGKRQQEGVKRDTEAQKGSEKMRIIAEGKVEREL